MWKWTEVIQCIRASTWLLSVCSQETSCEHSQEAGRVRALGRGGVGGVSVCVWEVKTQRLNGKSRSGLGRPA